jgi:site-specific recombinase XerD
MASLYKRARSPFWWIKFIDDTGRLRQESTGKRVDSVHETREARRLRAAKEFAERGAAPSERSDRDLSAWVQPWLDVTHKNQDLTLESYSGAWRNLLEYFTLKKIRSASEISRRDCFDYLGWRQNADNKNKRKRNACAKVKLNTALFDLRILRKILNEAVAREYIVRNPAARMGIKAEKVEEKPEISDEERAIVEATFPPIPDWREISWTIAINQGCRLSETSLPLSMVDFKGDKITFRLKRGRMHTTKMLPAVKALLLKLKEAGLTHTWAFHRNASRDWGRILQGLGLHFSFHSTRVTVITRLARAGVNEQQARRFIGHASSEIHAIYTRLQAEDLDSCVSALTSAKPRQDTPPKPEMVVRRRIGRPAKHRRV